MRKRDLKISPEGFFENGFSGNMNHATVRVMYERMRREQVLSKYTLPTKVSSDGYYHVQVIDIFKRSGRRQIKAKTIDDLIEKLVKYDSPTFIDIYKLTQEEKAKYCKGDRKLSVTNTITRNWQTYNRFFKDTDFEQLPVSLINELDVEDILYANLSRYELHRTAFTSMCTVLRQTLKYAYRHRFLSEDVVSRVDFSSPKFVNMLIDEIDISERIYSEQEIVSMLNYCREEETGPEAITAFALEFQIIVAARRDEVCSVKWSDIDASGIGYIEIKRELIFVKKSPTNPKSFHKIVEHTKTYKNRRIPIWNELERYLERLKTFHALNRIDSEFLFPYTNEYGCLSTNAVYKRYYRMCKKIGIPIKEGVIRGTHAYRRNFAKRIDDDRIASRLLGNSERVLRKNYYDGLNLTEAADILNGKH